MKKQAIFLLIVLLSNSCKKIECKHTQRSMLLNGSWRKIESKIYYGPPIDTTVYLVSSACEQDDYYVFYDIDSVLCYSGDLRCSFDEPESVSSANKLDKESCKLHLRNWWFSDVSDITSEFTWIRTMSDSATGRTRLFIDKFRNRERRD